MKWSGSLVTDLVWGYGCAPEFLTVRRIEQRSSDRFILKVKPTDDPFTEVADLVVTLDQVEKDGLLRALENCKHLRVVEVQSGPDLRLSNCVKWKVDVRPVTAADQMELLLVVDDLDGRTGAP